MVEPGSLGSMLGCDCGIGIGFIYVFQGFGVGMCLQMHLMLFPGAQDRLNVVKHWVKHTHTHIGGCFDGPCMETGRQGACHRWYQ